MRWHSYRRASQKQAWKGSPLVKKEASPKKQKEKELPNTPFNFGVIPISLLLLVLPTFMSCKNILVIVQQFIHSHTHIHAYIQNKTSSYNNPKRNHSSFLFNRAHTKHNKMWCCLTTTTPIETTNLMHGSFVLLTLQTIHTPLQWWLCRHDNLWPLVTRDLEFWNLNKTTKYNQPFGHFARHPYFFTL